MRASALIDIINRIDEIDADESVRRQFRQLVRQVGAEHGIACADRGKRVQFARDLLDLRVSRSTIRDRLMAHFEISRTQAYRVIDIALKVSHFPPRFGTANESNTTIEINSGVSDAANA
jgi:hypothetical protein